MLSRHVHVYLQWQHQVRVQVVGVLALPAGARSIREARIVFKGSLKEAVGIMLELKQDAGLIDMQGMGKLGNGNGAPHIKLQVQGPV